MSYWQTLGIHVTTDKKEIKRAYAKMAAKYHPEEFPEKFKEVHEAYKYALSYVKYMENVDSMRDEGKDATQVDSLPPFFISRKTNSKESDNEGVPKPKTINWPDVQRETTAQETTAQETTTQETTAQETIVQKVDVSNDLKMEQPDFTHLMRKENQGRTEYNLQAPQKVEQAEEKKIEFTTLINQSSNKVTKVEQKNWENKIDFEKVEANDEEKELEKITKRLILRFQDLIIKTEIHNSEQWKWLLTTRDFQRVSKHSEFLKRFTSILRGVTLTKREAKVTFEALDFGTVERLYGTQYNELKKKLLDAMQMGKTKLSGSGMRLEDVLEELTLRKLLYGMLYGYMIFRAIAMLL